MHNILYMDMNMCIYKFDTCQCTHTHLKYLSRLTSDVRHCLGSKRGHKHLETNEHTIHDEPRSPMSSVSAMMIIFNFDYLQRIIATSCGILSQRPVYSLIHY